jgi:hypothetical protein
MVKEGTAEDGSMNVDAMVMATMEMDDMNSLHLVGPVLTSVSPSILVHETLRW